MTPADRKLEILHRVIVSANEAADMESLLQVVLQLTLEMLDFDCGGIYLVDEKRGVAEIQCSCGLPADFKEDFCRVGISSAPYSLVFIEHTSLFADDLSVYNPEGYKKNGLSSGASIPFIARDRVIGSLNVAKFSPHRFTNEEKDILNSIGRETATAIARMQSETALRESERKFKDLTEALPETVYEMDRHGILTFVNRNAFELFGYSARDLEAGINVLDLIAAEDLERASANFVRIINGEQPGYVEYNVKRKDGGTIPVNIITSPVIKNGAIAGFRGLLIDLRERKRFEAEQNATLKALRASEAKFRAVAETTESAIYIWQSGKFVYVNPSAERITGYSLEEMLGSDSFGPLIHSDFNEFMQQRGEARLQGETTPISYEVKIVTKSGAERWIDLSAASMEYEGRPAIIGTAFDITDRKKAETQRKAALDELAAEKERLSVTLYSIGEGVITTDISGKVALVNRIAERLTGWTQAVASGKPIDKILIIKDEKTGRQVSNFAGKVRKKNEGEGYRGRAILVSRDGSEKYIAVSSAPIRDRDGSIIGAVLAFRDITESIAMEQELLKSRNLESLSVLAGGIAHDFNNILTVILGNISLAKMQLDEKTMPHGLLLEAEKASQRARDLTQQLLTFSKGGAPIKKITSIAEILRDTANFTLSGSNIRARFHIPDNLRSVKVDEGQISQVINNLIINAQHAMPAGGTVEIKGENVSIEGGEHVPRPLHGPSLRPGMYVKITIRDHGMGIPPEHLPKIFDPYFTTKQKGSGLGLTTAYSIIKKHDGYLGAESQKDSGTTFTIFLPATEKHKRVTGINSFKFSRQKGRILLMDDDELVLKVAVGILHQLGCETAVSHDGAEVIEKYISALSSPNPFDAVIMDLTVPGGMGGKEAVKRLLKIDPSVRAIVSSGYSNDPVMSDFKKFGFSGVISKPYTIRDMASALKSVLKKKLDGD